MKTYKVVQKPMFRSGFIRFYTVLYHCTRFHTFLFFILLQQCNIDNENYHHGSSGVSENVRLEPPY